MQFGVGGTHCGTSDSPFDNLAAALGPVNNNGTIHIKTGSGSVGTTLDPGGKTVTLVPEGGNVTFSP